MNWRSFPSDVAEGRMVWELIQRKTKSSDFRSKSQPTSDVSAKSKGLELLRAVVVEGLELLGADSVEGRMVREPIQQKRECSDVRC